MVDSRISFTEVKNRWFLHPHCRFLHASLVRPFAPSTSKTELIVDQGCKDFHYIDCDSDHPLADAEEDPTMYENLILDILSVLW